MTQFVEVAAAEAAAEAVADIAATAGAVAAKAASEAAEREQHIVDAAVQAAQDSISNEDLEWKTRLTNIESRQIESEAAMTRVETLLSETVTQVAVAADRLARLETPVLPVVAAPSLEMPQTPLPSPPLESALSGEGVLPEALKSPVAAKSGKRAVRGWV